MGYELHITRRDDWWEAGENIPEADWRMLVDSDPSLALTGSVSAISPDGSQISYENPLLAEWSHAGRSVPFDFRSGRVVVKSPDGPILAKMIEIAEALNAKVVGDEGEVYTTAETHGIALEGVPKSLPASGPQQSGGGCFGVFVALTVLALAFVVLINGAGANKPRMATTTSPSVFNVSQQLNLTTAIHCGPR